MNNATNAGVPRQADFVSEEGVRLDRKFTVDFSYCEGTHLAQWSPDVPNVKQLRELMPAYLKARNGFLKKVSQMAGGAIVVMNPDGTISTITGEGVL